MGLTTFSRKCLPAKHKWTKGPQRLGNQTKATNKLEKSELQSDPDRLPAAAGTGAGSTSPVPEAPVSGSAKGDFFLGNAKNEEPQQGKRANRLSLLIRTLDRVIFLFGVGGFLWALPKLGNFAPGRRDVCSESLCCGIDLGSTLPGKLLRYPRNTRRLAQSQLTSEAIAAQKSTTAIRVCLFLWVHDLGLF